MNDYLLIFAVVWVVIGFAVAAYSIGKGYRMDREWILIQIAWPYFLFELPFLIRERNRNNQERAKRLGKKLIEWDK